VLTSVTNKHVVTVLSFKSSVMPNIDWFVCEKVALEKLPFNFQK